MVLKIFGGFKKAYWFGHQETYVLQPVLPLNCYMVLDRSYPHILGYVFSSGLWTDSVVFQQCCGKSCGSVTMPQGLPREEEKEAEWARYMSFRLVQYR